MNRHTIRRTAVVVALAAAATFGTSQAADAKTKKVHKPTASCVAALDSAERAIHLGSTFATAISGYFTELQQASQIAADGGGAVAFIDALTMATQRLTPQIQSITAQVNTESAIYNPASAKCRAGR